MSEDLAQLTDEDLAQILEEAEFHEQRIAELEHALKREKSSMHVLEAQLKMVKGEKAMLQGKYRRLEADLDEAKAQTKGAEGELKSVGAFRLIELHEKDEGQKAAARLELEVEEVRSAAHTTRQQLEAERRQHETESEGLRTALRHAGKAHTKLDGVAGEHSDKIANLQMELFQRRNELQTAPHRR